MRLTPRLALMLSVPPLLWAGNAVVGRLAIQSMPPLWLNASRWALALALLLPLGACRTWGVDSEKRPQRGQFLPDLQAHSSTMGQKAGKKWTAEAVSQPTIPKSDRLLGWRVFASATRRAEIAARWRPLALLSLTGVGAYNALQYLALQTSTPLNVTLIAASSPVWAMAIGAAFYGVRPHRAQLLGAALSLAGVAVVLARGDWAALQRVQLVPGDLLMLLAILSWCVYSWWLARPPPSLRGAQRPAWHWAEFLCIQIAMGLAWAAAGAGLGEWLQPHPAPIHWTPWLLAALLYVAIGPSLIAYRLWGLGVAEAGPAVATFFGNLTPLFAALLSAALLGEWPQPFHGLAFALIVTGIVVSSRPAPPARA